MQINNVKRIILFCFAFLVLWALYIIKIAPTYIAGDSPETIMAFNFLGIQHPPGYALNTLLGKIFLLIPVGNIMFRSAIMAMFFNIITSIVLFIMALIIFDKKGKKYEIYCAALMAAAFYLFSNTVFFQGLTAKGSVYTLHCFIIVAIFVSLFKINKNVKYLYLSSFLFGLSLGNHWQSSVVLFPAMALSVYMERKEINVKTWLNCLLLFLTGISIFTYLFIRSAAHPLLMWGDITDLKSLMWLLGRGQYNPLEQGHTLNDTIRLLKYYFVNILPEQYPLLLAFILIPGTVLLARKLPKYGYVLNTAFIISTVSVIFTATNGPGLEFIIKQFLTFTYIFAAIFIAYCVYWIIGLIKNERIRIISMFILSITIVFLLYSKAPNYSRYFLSYDYSSNLTETIPEGAVYFAEGDLNCFGALYKNFIEKKNINEITVILLDQDWYREQLKRNYKDKIVVTDKASNPVADIKNLMYANRDKRIYYSNAHEEKLLSFTLVPRGIANEIIINKHPLYYDPYLYFKLYSYRGIFSDNMKYDDFTIVFTFEHYGLNLQELGNQFYTKGDIDKALFFFKRSFLFFENENVAALIGDCYFRKGDYESGLNYLRQAFQINRKCISAHYYMALYYISMKDIVNARQNILEILEYDPGNIQAQELLNKLNGGT